MATADELRTQRTALIVEADNLAKETDFDSDKEKEAKFDELTGKIDDLRRKIELAEKREKIARERAEAEEAEARTIVDNRGTGAEELKEEQERYSRAFRMYMIYGRECGPDHMRALRAGWRNPPTVPGETRAPQTITTSGGGYLIPQGFSNELERRLKAYGGMRTKARILRTDSGNPLMWPTVDDTSNVAQIVAINIQSTETALTFGQVELDAFMYRSMILVPFELLQDSAFDLNVEVPDMISERILRGTNVHFTTGNGSTQPQGVVTGATSGKTAALSSTTTYDELVDLYHSVDPAYRARPNFSWMFNDSTLKVIRKIKDSQNRPIWEGVPFTGAAPDMILGAPYIVNQDMASIAAGAKPILIGDLSKFIIRDVNQVIALRLEERYADYGQVGFITFSRHDSGVIDAGGGAIKYMTMPSP